MTPNKVMLILKAHALEVGKTNGSNTLPKTAQQALDFRVDDWIVNAATVLAQDISKMDAGIKCALQCIDKNPQLAKEYLLEAIAHETKLEPVEVKRDSQGCWTHPDLPFLETLSFDEINGWLHHLNLKLAYQSMKKGTDDYNQFVVEQNRNISLWEPTCNVEGAFLILIDNSSDEPIAFFAVPLS
ncbi:hypothetical protein [Pseudoalteromonas luteoviolacea]|uniref:hypothetical protein n=1 Tax=Pseudoalteromonas luteoviolacea TaxID=43657 RepID=UPI001151112C|nr:hypothetical protein [Pseudoalteromonas luteoviolacea]TQF71345.1 hypothetical protein FLM44_09715 [Pseudoalteromonas luteoviolacea]